MDVRYSVDALTGEGRIGLTQCTPSAVDTNNNVTDATFWFPANSQACAPGLTADAVTAWVRSLAYVNERKDVTGGNRVIRVDVWSVNHLSVGKRIDQLGNLVTSLVGGDQQGFGVAASAVRTLKVAGVNNAPRINVNHVATWVEKGADVAVLDPTAGFAVGAVNAQTGVQGGFVYGFDSGLPVVSFVPGAVTGPQVVITDSDDNDMTAAYVQITTTVDSSSGAGAPTYGACDPVRDRLYLLPNYLDAAAAPADLAAGAAGPAVRRGASPKLVGSWSSASCTLTLVPAAPLFSVTKADMTVALLAVRYANNDYYNPVNYDDGSSKNNHGRIRQVTVNIVDAANQGKLANQMRNVLAAPAAATNAVLLTLVCYNDVPVVNVADIFGVGGILSSTNNYANIRTTYDAHGVVKIKAFPLLTPQTYSALGQPVAIPSQSVTVYQIPFDLTQVTDAAGAPVPGLFAKGQIYDPDSASPPTSTAQAGNIDIRFWDDVLAPQPYPSGSGGAAVAATDAAISLYNMALKFGNSNNGPSPIGELCQTCVFYINPATGLPAWQNPVTQTPYTTGFSYSATGPSVMTIILNNNVPLSMLGPYKLRLQFGVIDTAQVTLGTPVALPTPLQISNNWPQYVAPAPGAAGLVDPWSAAIFYVDVRQKACVDPSASRAAPDDGTTETNVIKRINNDQSLGGLLNQLYPFGNPLPGYPTLISSLGAASQATYLAASGLTAAQAVTEYENFFPENSLCAYLPTPVVAASGKSYTVERDGFATLKAALDSGLAALRATGASVAAQAAALKDLRNSARGAFEVFIPAGSLASRGSMDFTATKVDVTAVALLPALLTAPVESFDTDVAVRLQPAGTSFSAPVSVCIFTGDTPPNSFKYLSMAQQKDAGDPTKGFLYWQTLFGQTFNPATGEVCGLTTHFTVFAPITRPTANSSTVAKAHLMGGSCPNACSGQGACRQNGHCVCFAGFEGYDCSMRTCPSAESWGEDQGVMHTMSECAGRGVCQRSTGTCSCFAGFEGSACERATCPNDCSGQGKCRTVGELPAVQHAGYSGWELKRMQMCVCDGGYSGADCSQRHCPFGDDPETICSYSQRQIQRVTLDFRTDPTGTGNPNVDLSTDQFALIFTTVDGKNYTTPMIDNIWDGTPAAAASMANALRTLPEFAVMGVEIASKPTDAGSLKVHYDLTFSGSTNTGNELLMSCPFNSVGSTGCPAPGCRPKFTQLRILQASFTPTSVQLSPNSVLQQPRPLGFSAADNTADTPNIFGVEITLVINKYFMPGSTAIVYTYQFVNTKVYGQTVDASGENAAVTSVETPFPPPALRSNIPGPYGVAFNFGDDVQLSIDFSGNGPFTYEFGWRLPVCSVEVVQEAAVQFEKAECSNRGLCNRLTGQCECFTNYAGFSCSQQTVYV